MLNNVTVQVNFEPSNPITFTHSKAQVTDLSANILQENLYRKYLLIANVSDEDIFISLSGDAVPGAGIPINAGGNYQMPAEYIATSIISAVHAGEGEKTLLITEGV